VRDFVNPRFSAQSQLADYS